MEELVADLERSEGIMTVTMLRLRNAFGKERLGSHVVAGIAAQLKSRRIAHSPNSLPSYQNEQVRLYKMGTPVADIIQAARRIGPKYDRLLREATGGNAAAILDQVRALVYDADEAKGDD